MAKDGGFSDDVRPEQRPALGAFSTEAQKAKPAEAFVAHKKAHPESVPYENLSHLLKRMKSEAGM